MDTFKYFPKHLIILVIYFVRKISTTALFTGVDNLKKLSNWENENIDWIERYIKQEEDKLKLIKILLDDIIYTRQTSGSVIEVAGNPMQAYNLIKRWNHLRKIYESSFQKKKRRIRGNYPCKDVDKHCREWANSNQCKINPDFMNANCPKSCGLCEQEKANTDTAISLKHIADISGCSMPEYADYQGAAEGLLRIQRGYNLSTSDLMAGKIKGYISSKGLDPGDWAHIGGRAMVVKEYGYAAQWLKPALQHPELTDKERLEAVSNLASAYEKMGRYKQGVAAIESVADFSSEETDSDCMDYNEQCYDWAIMGECDKNPSYMHAHCRESCRLCDPKAHYVKNTQMHNYLPLRGLYKRLKRRDKPELNTDSDEDTDARPHQEEWRIKYEALCRGENLRIDHTVKCRYRPTVVPWYRFQEEILDWDPYIALVYDIISDQEADIIKGKSRENLSRGVVGSSRETSNVRISNVGWLRDEDSFIRGLTKRVELITGLDASTMVFRNNVLYSSADALQVVNYGIGGHYEPHTDYFDNPGGIKTDVGVTIRNSGDRIATFLIYLSDVIAGGATVFPKEHVYVPPIKNGAAFWFNCKRTGEYDRRTLHAGCPVLLGEKWVSNKWIREFGNHFKDRCGLTRNDLKR